MIIQFFVYLCSPIGVLSSVGSERLLHTQEVGSSNLPGPTQKPRIFPGLFSFPSADFWVFGADRLIILLSGAIFGDFGAERLIILLSGAIFWVFGAEGLPELTQEREGKREGLKGWYDFVEVRP